MGRSTLPASPAHRCQIDGDDVAAGLEDGVLRIRLPKPEHERPRHITVS